MLEARGPNLQVVPGASQKNVDTKYLSIAFPCHVRVGQHAREESSIGIFAKVMMS